jgi:hypothetical protein
VITIEEFDSLLPLIKDKRLRFLLKAGSKLLFLRTCYFSDPYYQPTLLHKRIDHVFKDFDLSKYLVLKETDVGEELPD